MHSQGMVSYQKAEAEVELNKLNCIMEANPLYYSYGIADYFFGGFYGKYFEFTGWN
mgnify:FL=1